jgi:tetratricopeptide (TPR) repeat protein
LLRVFVHFFSFLTYHSLREADGHFKNGYYAKAIECYTKAIEQQQDGSVVPAVCYSNRSASYAKLGDWEKAAADGAATILSDENFMKGYTRSASALEELGNLEEALIVLYRGLAIDPFNEVCSG